MAQTDRMGMSSVLHQSAETKKSDLIMVLNLTGIHPILFVDISVWTKVLEHQRAAALAWLKIIFA